MRFRFVIVADVQDSRRSPGDTLARSLRVAQLTADYADRLRHVTRATWQDLEPAESAPPALPDVSAARGGSYRLSAQQHAGNSPDVIPAGGD